MTLNVGIADRAIRTWVGIALVLFAYMRPELPFAVFGWLGLIPLITGILGWCPFYRLMGITTVRNP